VTKNPSWLHRIVLSCLIVACSFAIFEGYKNSEAFAQTAQNPAIIVKNRIDRMKALKEAFSVLTMMTTGKRDYDSKTALAAATKVEKITAEILEMFPKGSLIPPSEALPAIWEDWDRFRTDAETSHGETLALVEAIAHNDQADFQNRHKNVGRTCKMCHRRFKQR